MTTLLIRGYDPLDDAIDYGRELIPLVRQELAHRAATAAATPTEPATSTDSARPTLDSIGSTR